MISSSSELGPLRIHRDAVAMDDCINSEFAVRISLADTDAEIELVPIDAPGRRPESEVDQLRNILNTFNEQLGSFFADSYQVAQIREDIASKGAADAAYQNAKETTSHCLCVRVTRGASSRVRSPRR